MRSTGRGVVNVSKDRDEEAHPSEELDCTDQNKSWQGHRKKILGCKNTQHTSGPNLAVCIYIFSLKSRAAPTLLLTPHEGVTGGPYSEHWTVEESKLTPGRLSKANKALRRPCFHWDQFTSPCSFSLHSTVWVLNAVKCNFSSLLLLPACSLPWSTFQFRWQWTGSSIIEHFR